MDDIRDVLFPVFVFDPTWTRAELSDALDSSDVDEGTWVVTFDADRGAFIARRVDEELRTDLWTGRPDVSLVESWQQWTVRAADIDVIERSVFRVERILEEWNERSLVVTADDSPLGVFTLETAGIRDDHLGGLSPRAPTTDRVVVVDDDSEPPTPTPTPAQAQAEVDPRRLGVDIHLGAGELVNAFVSGQPNTVTISIGRTARHRSGEGIPRLHPTEPAQKTFTLPAWALMGGNLIQGEITLPVDDSEDSTDDFEFTFAPENDAVVIAVVIYRPGGDEVLQAAVVRGGVVSSLIHEAAAEPSISVEVVEVNDLVHTVEAEARGSLVFSDSGLLFKSGGAPVGVTVETAADWIEETVKEIEQAALAEATLDVQIEEALVNLAYHGADYLSQLPELRDLLDSANVQVVSLVGGSLFPIELLYSGPEPLDDAELCPNWKQSLRAGACTDCGDDGPADGSVVCPLCFWSMSKVIEHHGLSGEYNTPFSASTFRTLAAEALRSPGPVIVAASSNVTQNALEGVTDQASVFGDAHKVANWNQWKQAVATHGPGMLVAMPHQDLKAKRGRLRPVLEIGGVEASVFDESYLLRPGDRPGPIVLLIGCDSAIAGDKAFRSFASLFKSHGASVVISSLGEVIASQAPTAVASFLSTMNEVREQCSGGTIGEIILRTRQKVLAESKLLALMLVCHGDTQWRVT